MDNAQNRLMLAQNHSPVPDNIIDGYIIAEMELLQKRIPFIIQRPLHGGVTEMETT